MRILIGVFAVGCSMPVALHLPPVNAPAIDRRAMYRWSAISHVARSRHGTKLDAVLTDGRVVHDVTALAAVVPAGSVTATALDRYRRDGATTNDWGLAALATMSATFVAVGAEALELDAHRGPIIAGTAVIGVIALGLLMSRAEAAARDSNDDLTIAYAHYNDDLRDALHLCVRELAIVDCD